MRWKVREEEREVFSGLIREDGAVSVGVGDACGRGGYGKTRGREGAVMPTPVGDHGA